MPHVLEIKGGELLTPLNVLDVMEAVEDYMGTDIRQYLEEYLLEAESEAGEEIYDHYKQVLMNIKDETEAAVRLMEKPRMDRKAIRVTLDIILKMIEREY
ncbi:hypothetical protein [Enterocloster clostridioformis]|uniref:Uncharacterized protein n=1 Tax=Enterocloster clostridioformis TaxID=1531 RepID=A0A1I0KEV1_9FIRM|nr:hypothetical protein [Enterocloster clostridioformis]MDB2135964.1 hypothetical protein [Enterocloster clostridioformis]SEU22962.1 hypothetical protein SAMN05216521_11393 [Enterocloster clostridioformis]SEW49837.1 hypothetical protein SAMN05216528_11333 [Enterocloster clostridioformis]